MKGPEKIDSVELGLLELYTREYIYRIHVRRVVALKKDLKYIK